MERKANHETTVLTETERRSYDKDEAKNSNDVCSS